MCLAGGEVIFGSVVLEVVEFGADIHGDAGLRGAIGEEEGVLIGGGDRVRVVESGERRR